jgi:hypothetical protein
MLPKRFSSLSGVLLVTASVAIVAQAPAQTLAEAVGTRTQANQEGQASQQRVDTLSDQTDSLASEYRSALKQIESLRVYNSQLGELIASQEVEMASLQGQIDDVEIVERGIPPLMAHMIDALEAFVGLDVPFLRDERSKRVEGLRELMLRADVTNAEKYRRIVEAYQIENDYGRTIEAYRGTHDNGKTVDFLRVGRIALVYQTLDGLENGAWDQDARDWVSVDSSHSSAIKDGLKIARKQSAPDMILLPIAAATQGGAN